MPEISPERFQSDLGSQTTTVYLDLLRITHSQYDTMRLVNDKQDLIRDDGTYEPFPIEAVEPVQTDQRPPTLQITVDIVDYRIIEAVRSLRGLRERPLIELEIVTAHEPNVAYWGPAKFRYEDFSTDGLTTGTLSASFIRGALDNSYPGRRISPSNAGS